MAIRKDSTRSESITVRVPKELMEKARSIVGGGNTQAVLTALRLLCGDVVPNTVPVQGIIERITVLEEEVSNLKKAQARSDVEKDDA